MQATTGQPVAVQTQQNPTFTDLHVVVTGGTGALGRGVVDRLLQAGAICHVPCFDPAELAEVSWGTDDAVHLYEGIDLTDETATAAFFSALPPLWASIQCAGGFAMSPLEEIALADLERLWRLNTVSCFLCCREAIARMRHRADDGGPIGGRLVNVAARPALEPRAGAGMTAYTMTKAAVAAFTVALGEEVIGDSILVNAVAPSIIDSAANRQAMPDANTELWPTPEAIAESIVFLASPANTTTRSAIVPVYGAS